MAPFKLKRDALRQLNRTFEAMMSDDWDDAVVAESAAVQSKAGRRLMEVMRARRQLRNSILDDIRDALLENEEDLLAGQANLDASLQDLAQVERVLTSVTGFLKTIGRVVTLV